MVVERFGMVNQLPPQNAMITNGTGIHPITCSEHGRRLTDSRNDLSTCGVGLNIMQCIKLFDRGDCINDLIA